MGNTEIIPQSVGELNLDMVSRILPQSTFKGRKNGLRKDLAQVSADVHPPIWSDLPPVVVWLTVMV